MGEACSTREGKGDVHTGFWWETLRQGGHLQVLTVDGRIILKRTFEKWDGCMDWIDLLQDKDRWWALVNAVMNHRVP